MFCYERQLWFALQVRPRHEKTVSTILAAKGYERFLPTCRLRRRWSDRIKVIEQPLFPGYVFCRSHTCLLGVARETPGITRIVSFGGRPYPLAEEEIEALQRVVESKREVCPVPYLKIGEKVQVITGPLTGIRGIITQLKKRERLIISVDLIMKSICVDIAHAEIARADVRVESSSPCFQRPT
jgi:transcription antitermination factor NusG